MRYTDRCSIGLEQILLERVDALDDTEEYTGARDGGEDRISSILSKDIMLSLDRLIQVNLSLLRDERPEAYGRIPEDIRTRYDEHASQEDREKRVGDFLEWFSRLRRANEQARVERTAELNNFCSSMGGTPAGQSMARNFLGLNNQRVIAVRDAKAPGDILLEGAEREWGRSVIRFTGCVAPEGAELPLPGYLYCFEGTADGGGFHVRMLVDSSFGGEEYPDRLMSDSGWHELSFDCAGVSAEPVFYDYAGRMQRMGTPRFELVERCCELLVSKSEIMGKEALTWDERALLPAAQLMRGSDALMNRDESESDNHFRYLIFQALDNRYAMRQLCELLGQSGRQKLKKELEGTLDSFEGGDEDDAVIQRAESFWGCFETEVASGAARPLLAKLSERLVEMTSGLPGDPYRSRLEGELLGRVRDAAAPELERMGFSGSYPHYYREKDRCLEYISFILDADTDRPHRGVISYYASVAAARLAPDQWRTLEELGVPREQSNALDCLPEEIGLSDYGELAGISDAQYVRMDISIYGGRVTHDESGRLKSYIRLAESQFLRKRIPSGYRRSRLRAGSARGAFGRSLAACAPVGVAAAVILLLIYNFWLRGQPFYTLSGELTAAASIAGGLIAIGAAALIRNLICSFRIWRY